MKLPIFLYCACIGVLLSKNVEWDGTSYHKNNSPQIDTAHELLQYCAIKPYEYILDLGCGTGEITAYLSTLVPQGTILGIDFAPTMIDYAKKSFQKSNLSFQEQDITIWPFAENCFDRIVSFSCLHWIEDIQPILTHCTQSLKPGGIFMTAVAHVDHFLYKPLLTTAALPKWERFFNNKNQKPWYPHTTESFNQLLIEAQLEPITINAWYKKSTFESKQYFINWIRAWIVGVPHIQQLPENLRHEFILEIIENFLCSVAFNANGSLEFLNPILLVVARKN